MNTTLSAPADFPAAEDISHLAAKEAHLRYVSDSKPGIRRERGTNGEFVYVGLDGREVADVDTLARIKSLAIPPAYTDVWICPIAYGHLQATGRDERGRKQYRYHERWAAVRDQTKYSRMIAFAEALPAIREQVARDLSRTGLPREKVLATLVRLLETTLIRVGNEEYAKANGSFGLTTMEVRHVDIQGSKLHFSFRGKSGKFHEIDLRDKRLANVVARCKDLPGREVFCYRNDEGELHPIHSEDVNDYIHKIANAEFTAKDFRTWAGTVLTAVALCECEQCTDKKQLKRNIVEAIKKTSAHLGNTPAVCRKSYIHPEVLAAYDEGMLSDIVGDIAVHASDGKLTPQETAVLNFLKAVQDRPARKKHR